MADNQLGFREREGGLRRRYRRTGLSVGSGQDRGRGSLGALGVTGRAGSGVERTGAELRVLM